MSVASTWLDSILMTVDEMIDSPGDYKFKPADHGIVFLEPAIDFSILSCLPWETGMPAVRGEEEDV